MEKAKAYKTYGLGLALQTSKEHPWGKGAASKYSAHELVEIARRKGYSYKYIFKKANAVANILEENSPSASETFRSAANIARAKAHEKGEFKSD